MSISKRDKATEENGESSYDLCITQVQDALPKRLVRLPIPTMTRSGISVALSYLVENAGPMSVAIPYSRMVSEGSQEQYIDGVRIPEGC